MILQQPEQMAQPARRIISLVPSQTELLYHLGLEDETVGITKFCIHPTSWFQSKIRVGGTKNIDNQRIENLRPDLIIANKEENVREQVENLAALFPVWVTDVNNLEDACQMINDIGLLTGKVNHARALAEEIQTAFIDLPRTKPVPAAYLIWKDPYMAAGGGTFINDMLFHAGFTNVFGDRQRYPQVTLQDIAEAKPRLILLSSEPYPFSEKHIGEFDVAMPGTKIILADGEMFSWYGSRLTKAPAYFKTLALSTK